MVSLLFKMFPNDNISIIAFKIVLDLEARIKSLNNSYILLTASRLETQYY